VARRARSMRWGALDPGLRPPRPAARNAPRHEGRPPNSPCGARRDVEGRRVVRSHGVVVAAARWGALVPGLTRASARLQDMKRHTGGEARQLPGTRLGSAPWGDPRSGQQPTRHEGTRPITADAACLGWPRRGGAPRATRVAARPWKNGGATDVRRHEGTRTGRLREGTVQGEGEVATVLTAGRRWSRGRLGGEVSEGEVEVHAGGRPPRLLLLVPGWFTSSPFRRGAASPWRVYGVPAVKRSSPLVRSSAPSSTSTTRRRRARFFSQTSAHGRWWKRKPQEGVGGFDSVPHRPAPFESKPRAARGGKGLSALGRSPGGAGGARGGARVRLGCSVGRGRGVNRLSPRSHPVPRARAPHVMFESQ
jgi:hypothetical protein